MYLGSKEEAKQKSSTYFQPEFDLQGYVIEVVLAPSILLKIQNLSCKWPKAVRGVSLGNPLGSIQKAFCLQDSFLGGGVLYHLSLVTVMSVEAFVLPLFHFFLNSARGDSTVPCSLTRSSWIQCTCPPSGWWEQPHRTAPPPSSGTVRTSRRTRRRWTCPGSSAPCGKKTPDKTLPPALPRSAPFSSGSTGGFEECRFRGSRGRELFLAESRFSDRNRRRRWRWRRRKSVRTRSASFPLFSSRDDYLAGCLSKQQRGGGGGDGKIK